MEPFSTIFLTLAHFKTGAGIKYQTESETILLYRHLLNLNFLYRHVQQKYFVYLFSRVSLNKASYGCVYLSWSHIIRL